jgi:hypothetical protein
LKEMRDMDELRRLLARGRPGVDYWCAYWRLREELTKAFDNDERRAVAFIKNGLAVDGRRAA